MSPAGIRKALEKLEADHTVVHHVSRATAHLYERVKNVVPSVEWPFFAPYVKAINELKSLAQSKDITLPTTLGAKDKALEKRLSRLSGAAFDRAYMQAMVNDHRTDVSEFRRESQVGKDPELKQWASKTLPTLEEHLKMAQDTSKTAVATSGTEAPKARSTTNCTEKRASNRCR